MATAKLAAKMLRLDAAEPRKPAAINGISQPNQKLFNMLCFSALLIAASALILAACNDADSTSLLPSVTVNGEVSSGMAENRVSAQTGMSSTLIQLEPNANQTKTCLVGEHRHIFLTITRGNSRQAGV